MSPIVRRYLAAYVRRRRWAAATRAAGWALAVGVAWALVACLGDRWLRLPAAVRAGAAAVAVVGPLAIVVGPMARLARRRFDAVAVAAAIERRRPAFEHRLVAVASDSGAAELRAAVERQVVDVIATAGPVPVAGRPMVAAWGAALFMLCVAAGLWRWAWLDLPHLAQRLARPTAGLPAVTRTRLAVAPGTADVIEGRSLALAATATGLPAGGGVTLHLSDDGQTWATRPMSPAGVGFAATLANVDRDARYFVTAGDATSPTYAVRVHRVPAVVAFRMSYAFPTVLRRPPVAMENADGEIDAPAGTTVTVDLAATVPLSAAELTVGAQQIQTMATADPCVRRGRFTVSATGAIGVRLTGADGTVGVGPRSAQVRVESAGTPPDVVGFEEQQRAYGAALHRADGW